MLVSPAAIVGVPLYLLVSGPPPGVDPTAGLGWRVPGRSTFTFLIFLVACSGLWQLF